MNLHFTLLSLCFVLIGQIANAQINKDYPLFPPPPPPPPNVSASPSPTLANKQLLIPYNDHGNWGYCDTLGNLIIAPQYVQASFFPISTKDKSILKDCASVKTSHGTNFIRKDGSLLFPKKMDMNSNLYHFNNGTDRYWIAGKKGKLGIYDLLEKNWHTQPKFDVLDIYDAMLLGKKEGDEVLTLIDFETKLTSKTNFVSVEQRSFNANGQLQDYQVLKTTTSEYYYYSNGELKPLSREEYESAAYGTAVAWETKRRTANIITHKLPEAIKNDIRITKVIDSQDFSNWAASRKYGFTQLFIVKDTTGKYGVVNEENKMILPFDYEEVAFNPGGSEVALRKDGLWGRKLFFSHYPMIEPLYQACYFYTAVFVTSSWRFNIYAIEKDGQKGYIGENGVRYFNLE